MSYRACSGKNLLGRLACNPGSLRCHLSVSRECIIVTDYHWRSAAGGTEARPGRECLVTRHLDSRKGKGFDCLFASLRVSSLEFLGCWFICHASLHEATRPAVIIVAGHIVIFRDAMDRIWAVDPWPGDANAAVRELANFESFTQPFELHLTADAIKTRIPCGTPFFGYFE
jgi:hypothetical protein